MAFYGINCYEKCIKLLEVFKEKNLIEINSNDLAIYIAKYIGSSKFLRTVRNYIDYLEGFNMIEKIDKNKYKINYDVLND